MGHSIRAQTEWTRRADVFSAFSARSQRAFLTRRFQDACANRVDAYVFGASFLCSFGKIAQMWRILLWQMDEQPDAATNVIKSITVLHNFILRQESERSVV